MSRPHGAWLSELSEWPSAAVDALQDEVAIARIVIARVRGSAPREVGTCMLVGLRWTLGTIGGGQLEFAAIATARTLLTDLRCPPAQLHRFVLGSELAQCCGGIVELWVERFTRADLETLSAGVLAQRLGWSALSSSVTDEGIERQIVTTMAQPDGMHTRAQLMSTSGGRPRFWERLDTRRPSIWLYGAGHVGQALIRVLERLPVQVAWIDSRAEQLPDDVAPSIQVMPFEPLQTVSQAPPTTRFVIVTHSHELDFALCRAVLERRDFAWAGVIGSKSKSARFRSRLAREGVSPAQIGRLVCPIGIDGVDSKLPAVIAVAVAAQLVQTLHTSLPADTLVNSPDTAGHCFAKDPSQEQCAACALPRGAS